MGFIVALMVLSAVLRGHALWSQVPTIDDASVVLSSVNYVSSGQAGPAMPFHPRLRDLIVWVSTGVLGTGALGVKGPSFLMGVLSIPLLWGIIWLLTRSELASTVGAALLALDGVHIDYSRQSIQEVHTAFFFLAGTLLAVWAMTDALREDRTDRWLYQLPLAGIAFGLSAASKWHGVFPLAACVGLLVWITWRRRSVPEAAFVVVSMLGAAATVYLATWIPWFARGYDLGEWFAFQSALAEAAALHKKVAVDYLAFDNAALWFVQPFAAYVDVAYRGGKVAQVFVAMGNPLVWMAVLPAAGYSLYANRARRTDQILQVLFWTAYLPLALAPRQIWILSSIAVTPFAFAIIGVVVADLSRRWSARYIRYYLAAVVVMSALLYPLAIGAATKVGYLDTLLNRMGDYETTQLRATTGAARR